MEKPPISDTEKEQLAALLEYYEKLSGIELPPTVESALAQGWELIEAEGIAVGAVLSGSADRQRVMPMRVALAMLDEFEAGMIARHTLSRALLADSYLHLAGVALGTLRNVAVNAWDTLINVWSFGGLVLALIWQNPAGAMEAFEEAFPTFVKALEELWSGWNDALKLLLLSWEKGAFEESARRIFQIRDSYADRARKRCFPQSSTGRVRRRKVARL